MGRPVPTAYRTPAVLVFRILLPGILLFQLFNLIYVLSYTGFRLHTQASRVYFTLYLIQLAASLIALLLLRHAFRQAHLRRFLAGQYLYCAVLLLWSIAITVYDQRTSDQLYVYMLILISVAMLSYQPPRYSFPLFLTGQLLLMAALPLFQPAGVDNYGNYVNSAAFSTMAILISCSQYFNARHSFAHKQIIEEKSRELLAKSEGWTMRPATTR